ncbi:hypothetical protein FRC11_004149 [Ceratobasidium sp. 423]|nr:hypothetical protein FRC11_004149 [Ceratobasidium sp. 423]
MDSESDSGYQTPGDGRTTPDQDERSSLNLAGEAGTMDTPLQPSPHRDSIDTELNSTVSSSMWAARELYAWSRCKHPNVVELMGMAVFRDSLAMVSMWAESGTLPIYLERNPKADRCLLSVLISRGLTYLHSNSIIHGDLKGINVLISHDGIPMLNDFGNARIQNATLQFSQSTTGVKHTIRWAAPELFKETALLTYEADVYALGMTILETFTGDIPYANIKNDWAVMEHIFSKKFPTRPKNFLPEDTLLGDAIWDALTSCWSYQPMDRPTAKQASSFKRTSDELMNPSFETRLLLVACHNDVLTQSARNGYPYLHKAGDSPYSDDFITGLLKGLRKHELAATGHTTLLDRLLVADRKTGNPNTVALARVPGSPPRSLPPLPPKELRKHEPAATSYTTPPDRLLVAGRGAGNPLNTVVLARVPDSSPRDSLPLLPFELIEIIANFLFKLHPPMYSGNTDNDTICCVKPSWEAVVGFMMASPGTHKLGFQRWISVMFVRQPEDWDVAREYSWLIRELICLGGVISGFNSTILARFPQLRAVCVDVHEDIRPVKGVQRFAYREVFSYLPPTVRHLEIKHAHDPDKTIACIKRHCPDLESLWLGRCTMFNRSPPCSLWESHPFGHNSYISSKGTDEYAHSLAQKLSSLRNLRSIRLGVYLVPSTTVLAHRLFHTQNLPVPPIIDWHTHITPLPNPNQNGQDLQPQPQYAQISDLVRLLHQTPEEEICNQCWQELVADTYAAELSATRILKATLPSLQEVEWMDWFSPLHLGVQSWTS